MSLLKKGQAGIQLAISGLLVLVVGLVIVGLVGTFSAEVEENIMDDLGPASCADLTGFTGYSANSNLCYNISNSSQTRGVPGAEFNVAYLAINNTYNVMGDTDTVASVGIAVIIIGLILAAFGGFLYFKAK